MIKTGILDLMTKILFASSDWLIIRESMKLQKVLGGKIRIEICNLIKQLIKQ